MKALLYPEFGKLLVTEVPRPDLADDEVMLRVEACGICGSELETFKSASPRRTPPLVMGHEFCGVIDQTGKASGPFETGQRVVSNAIVACGSCDACGRGSSNLCERRHVFGMHRSGAFAQYVNVPTSALLPWPIGLPAEAACLAEPLGNGVHVASLTGHIPADRVLVIGAGPIGLMCQLVFQAMRGSNVVVADLVPERLDVALSLGASTVVDARKTDPTEIPPDRGFDLVIDAAGHATTKDQSVRALRPGGTTVWIGLLGNRIELNSYDVTLGEKSILGSYGATQDDMSVALDLMATGRVDVSSWVSTFPLDRGVDVFDRLLDGPSDIIKAVLHP